MTIGIALIGAGAIAREHVAAYRRLDGVSIRRVVDLDPDRASDLAAVAGATATTDLATALADPAVAAVDICTPPDTHAAIGIAAAERGKAIHVEKPVALSLAELDAMTAAASRHGVPLMVGQTTRFQPVHQELRAAIDGDAVGRIRMFHLSSYAGHVWPDGWRAWQLDPARCGGHVIHNGVHAIDLAVWLLGARPVRVFAREVKTFAPEMPTPDSFHVVLRFDDGALALLEWSYALRRRGEIVVRAVALGERGSLHHSTEHEPRPASDLPSPPLASLADPFRRQLGHWLRTLRGEEEPIVRLDEVRATLAAALAARRSIETGRAVDVAEIEEDGDGR
jgi:predicted dehydrogenase